MNFIRVVISITFRRLNSKILWKYFDINAVFHLGTACIKNARRFGGWSCLRLQD